MPLVDNTHYVDSAGWTAVTAWAANTAIAAGALRRQLATPSVGSERVFVCVVAGTTHATTEPTWTVTRGAKTTDNTVTWQECTGLSGVNGDLTNTPNWTTVKNTAIVLGQIIKRDNLASYQICTTAGTAGNGAEPSFSNTAGTTTADGTATWTSLGAVANFTGNQAPHARVSSALATNWAQAGNTIFVKSSHAETQSTTTTWTGPGTNALPCKILCHNGAAYPPLGANLTTGATVTQSGTSQSISFAGNYYIEGISFTHSANGSSISFSTGSVWQYLKNCSLSLTFNAATTNLNIGTTATGPTVIWDNVIVSFANVGASIAFGSCNFTWKNTASALAGSVLTSLVSIGSNAHCNINFTGLDLSAAGSGKTLFPADSDWSGIARMSNCKLNASVTIAAVNKPTSQVEVINCDSGDTNYRNERYQYPGAVTTDITVLRTDGATDGTTPISHKLVTNANVNRLNPLVSFPIAIWNESVGSPVTVTVEGIWGGGAVPNNDEIWLDLEYLSDGSFPLSSEATEGPATVITPGVAQGTSSAEWTGGGTTAFALSATATPLQKGIILARVKCARASSTFYIDPKLALS